MVRLHEIMLLVQKDPAQNNTRKASVLATHSQQFNKQRPEHSSSK